MVPLILTTAAIACPLPVLSALVPVVRRELSSFVAARAAALGMHLSLVSVVFVLMDLCSLVALAIVPSSVRVAISLKLPAERPSPPETRLPAEVTGTTSVGPSQKLPAFGLSYVAEASRPIVWGYQLCRGPGSR